MMSIFSDMVEDTLKVFLDDFSIEGDTFEWLFVEFYQGIAEIEEANLVLNW